MSWVSLQITLGRIIHKSKSMNPGTGIQQLVYKAIASGNKLVGEVMEATGLDEDTVRTAIARLRDAGDIARERAKGATNTSYYARGKKCLLAETWR